MVRRYRKQRDLSVPRSEEESRPKRKKPNGCPELEPIGSTRFWRHYASRLLSPLAVTALPLLFASELWLKVFNGTIARAWDGSGHFALAQLYDRTIFPDVFGWTHAYFGGMPFPNFYPPLFYWLVALLHHTHLFSFSTSFKIMIMLPALLLPAAIWLLSWKLSGNNRLVATCAASVILPLLVDYRFTNPLGLMGLSYTSTFLIGMYSQTLGFILLIGWYVVYFDERQPRPWRFALSAALLALALLANVFGAITAAVLAAATIIYDALKYFRSSDPTGRTQARSTLIGHLLSPIVAGCLTLFWLAPMFNAYDYFVTRPQHVEFEQIAPVVMWLWYALAAIGIGLWLRRPTRAMWPFLTTCLILAGCVFFAATFSPRWFPLYPPRLIATLNFLLAVPVGLAVASGLRRVAAQLGFDFELSSRPKARESGRSGRRQVRRRSSLSQQRSGLAITGLALTALIATLLIVGFRMITPPPMNTVAFYSADDENKIDELLRFARKDGRAGRYLVEIQPFSDVAGAHDGRALNSYLGAQGNETLSLFFREASPSVMFLNPLMNVLSVEQDVYGISSMLADDVDFGRQSLAQHLEQARFFGTRYLVMRSPTMKSRLAAERAVGARHDFGQWSVYELSGETPPPVRVLQYKPALIVSSLSLKGRRTTDYDFVRFAEEQFADNSYDVLLARSPERKIDRLGTLDNFGALIIDSYDFDDEALAFERLREFAQNGLLILLSSDSLLFRRIQGSLAEFPRAEIIERQAEKLGPWLESNGPTRSYGGSEIRRVWRQIRDSLDNHKVTVTSQTPVMLRSRIEQNRIEVDTGAQRTVDVPVLIATTYHPNWRRTDNEPIYTATPFFMLTFVKESAQLVYERRSLDRLGVVVSASALLLLCCVTAWRLRALKGRA